MSSILDWCSRQLESIQIQSNQLVWNELNSIKKYGIIAYMILQFSAVSISFFIFQADDLTMIYLWMKFIQYGFHLKSLLWMKQGLNYMLSYTLYQINLIIYSIMFIVGYILYFSGEIQLPYWLLIFQLFFVWTLILILGLFISLVCLIILIQIEVSKYLEERRLRQIRNTEQQELQERQEFQGHQVPQTYQEHQEIQVQIFQVLAEHNEFQEHQEPQEPQEPQEISIQILSELAELSELQSQILIRKQLLERVQQYCTLSLRSEQPCYICFQEYKDDDLVIQPRCNPHHIFHETCLRTWTQINDTCPLCRAIII